MSLLCWNCRGLGNPETVRELHNLVKSKQPHFLFLIETKVFSQKLHRIKRKMGFVGMIQVDPLGRRGGLAFLWKPEKGVEVMNYSQRHISIDISLDDSDFHWTFTGFYGNPDRTLRDESWKLLTHLGSLSRDAWLCMGDFNEIIDQSEKVGGAIRSEAQMQRFSASLEDCNLHDLGYRGSKFTWSNGRDSSDFIKERLDRAVATPRWCANFSNVSVETLPVSNSDHKPLLLIFDSVYRMPTKLFRYEAKWNVDEECLAVVKEVWEPGEVNRDPLGAVMKDLERSQAALIVWSRHKFAGTSRRIKFLMKRLEMLQQQESPGRIASIKEVQGELNKLLDMEDIRWRQRAKRSWFKEGDRNTQFFHAWANHRRRANFIGATVDMEGNIRRGSKEVGKAFISYFQHLFASEGVSGIEDCIPVVRSRVKPELNSLLSATFTREEINSALNQMQPLKSPGPDGFGVSFFKHHWGTIGDKVSEAILNFLEGGYFNPSINNTFIALIPKKDNAASVSDYRPISLCNVVYKIIAKVLANRLKLVLPSIISHNQSAFVPGRLITDNVMIAYEALHSMSSRMSGKKSFMAVKVDMKKAYDRVEWPFLEAMMRTMGFEEKWISLIMTCVMSVSYSVLVNGQPCGRITPSRGLRQGDPLSPYLFLIVAEGLSALLSQAEIEKRLTGVPIAAGGICLSHLFFADDSLLFCRANAVEWANLNQVLQHYEHASGQQLNTAKTTIFLSRNTSPEFRDYLNNLEGVTISARFDKYLGLPAMVGRSKKQSFASICGRVTAKLEGWKEKFLSQAGKEILLKAVIQALPTYCMSVFRLPLTLCKSLNALMNKFWWGNKSNQGRVHWMSWKRLGEPKNRGGMGFRDLEVFNLAMLAKQGWRLLSNPDSLVARVMKEKYHARVNFLEAKLGSRPSFVWRSILKANSILRHGVGWRVGNGEDIKIWKDAWLNPPKSRVVFPNNSGWHPESCVSRLIDQATGWWNLDLIHRLFEPGEARDIGSVVISPLRKRDAMIWRGSPSGLFTVRSAYHMEVKRRSQEQGESSGAVVVDNGHLWEFIWHLPTTPVVRNFCWKLCHDLLPTKLNLFHRKVVTDPNCPICNREPESTYHSLWSCPMAVAVWQEGRRKLQKLACSETDGRGLLLFLKEKLEIEELMVALTILRSIWHNRNAFVFEGKLTPPSQVMVAAQLSSEGISQALKAEDIPVRAMEVAPSLWTRPPPDVWKINWDAAISKEKDRMGVGVIIRDVTGRVLAARTKVTPHITEPATAEALAAWEAVVLARELGGSRILLEGDSSIIVSALGVREPSFRVYGQILNDTKSLFSHFLSVEVHHVRRSANQAAHLLAKHAISQLLNYTWFGECPIIIQNAIVADYDCTI